MSKFLEAARAAIATTAAATTTRTAAILRLVDLERTAFEVLAVEGLHGARGVRIGHFDEAETTSLAGVAIGDEGEGLDRAVGREQGTPGVFGRTERQVA